MHIWRLENWLAYGLIHEKCIAEAPQAIPCVRHIPLLDTILNEAHSSWLCTLYIRYRKVLHILRSEAHACVTLYV